MRTNIEIEDRLMEEAMRAACTKTKKETVELALKELILSRKRNSALQYRGRLKWQGDLDEMRQTW